MIYYVAFYNPEEEIGKRVANYAGEDKIDYICETLNSIGEKVTILSNTKSINSSFQGKKEYIKSPEKKIVMFSSLSNSNKFIHTIDVIWGYLQLVIFLLVHLRKNDVVLVYHSLGYRNLFNILKKVKNFYYILEVEELFQYIDCANSYKKKENKVFSAPDGFIFSNNVIEKVVNIQKKPNVIINGIYKSEINIGKANCKDKTRIVYAGSLEMQKGVDYVIKASEFLDGNFEISILGFGSKCDLDRVLNLINEINKKYACKVSYKGVLKGEEYKRYIQECDIGVCIQNPQDEFNLYEFPSKIFSYMSNGLKVVVNKLEQVEKSQVAPFLITAENTSPEAVAKAIRRTANYNRNMTDILNKLDSKFKDELKNLIKGE